MSEKVGEIYYDVVLDTGKMVSGQREAERRLDAVGKAGDGLQTRFTAIAAGITAALSAIAIDGLTSKIVTAQRQFDVMFASLKTMTGGAAQAGDAFARLQEFASKTPYSLDQAVNGFVKLKALGLDPSDRAMTSFGNTASAMGKDLTQMIEAVADASTGEFERLKEFGIKAKVQGDQVSLTFQGVTTTIKNSADQITEYLTKIGEASFGGAMSERMATLDGDISNLQDSWNALYLTISQAGVGDAISKGVKMATEAIQQATISIKNGELTEYFSAMRPYITAAEVAVVALAGAVASKLLQSFVAAAAQAYTTSAAIGGATLAARGFSAVLTALGGPIGIAITGLALLALNWDSVWKSAKTAAEISEDSAARIQRALARGSEAPMRALMAERDRAKAEMDKLDGEIRRAQDWAKSGEARWGKDATKVDTSDLDAKREAYRTAFNNANKAIDDLKRQQMEAATAGTPAPTPAPSGGGPAKPGTTSGAKFDSVGYMAGLSARVADEMDRVGIEEAEALRRHEELVRATSLTDEQAAAGRLLIAQDASQKRLAIQLKEAEDSLAIHNDMAAQEARAEAEMQKWRDSAKGDIAAVDPVAKLEAELQAKLALYTNYGVIDQQNAQLYADAKVALEQQTADKIKAIRDKEAAERQAQQSQQLTNYSNLFGNMAGLLSAFGGKQNAAYRAMFAASKAFALADSIIKIQQGIAAAASLPFPANLGAMATVAANTAGIVSTISSTNYGGGRQYGGPVDSGSMYRVNETGKPEMFTASNGNQYMLPSKSGSVTPADQVAQSSLVINQSFSFGAGVNRSELMQYGESIKQQTLAAVHQGRTRGGAYE